MSMIIGMGIGIGFPAPLGYPFVNPEAAAVVARMVPPPSDARKALIDAVWTGIKTIGVSKFDAFYMIAAHSAQAAKLNWIADQYNLSEVDGANLTFTADRGYQGNGSSSYLETGFNPVTAVSPKFTQNSGHISFWSRTAGQSNNIEMGNSTTLLRLRSTTDQLNHRVNASVSAVASSVTDGSGHFVSSRTGPLAADSPIYRNAVSLTTGSAVFAVESISMRILGRTDGVTPSFSIRQSALASIGAGLTAQNVSDLYVFIAAYMTAVGA